MNTDFSEFSDTQLVEAALEGSGAALDQLIRRHQAFIYTVALKMVLNPQEAQDLAQEALIKVATRLQSFQQKSSFKTWAYRIVVNHFLNQKRKAKMEAAITGFDEYGAQLDSIPMIEMNPEEQLLHEDWIQDARIGCMSGMLLCLDRNQRMVYILGEIFEIDSVTGGDILEISPANFRQRLSRARHDLSQFMNRKCGLINQNNPCRCHRKTRGFVQAGWVNPDNLQFYADFRQKIRDVVREKDEGLGTLMETTYQDLFQDHPLQEKDLITPLKKAILQDPKVRQIFDLED